jgi:PAS domain S-box-containing protein
MKTESIELLPIIEEIASLGSYETDMATGTWIGSDNFIKIFGLEKKEQYTVQEFQQLVHPEDFDTVMAYFARCLANKTDFNFEYRCINKVTGQVIYVNSRSKIFYDSKGVPLKILGVKQDITSNKMHELKLTQLNDNNYKKNEVLAMVAHDLRSPISQLESIVGILKSEIGERYHDLISLQERICRSAKAIISELIEISELEDEAYILKTIKTNVSQLIAECIERFKYLADEKNILLKSILEPACFAEVDAAKFTRAIENLISNAIKFTPENKTLELSTHFFETKCIIKIKDEGIGIQEQFIPILFEKFSKLVRRTGTRGENSNGLGLSIVKQIIDLHKGSISVESAVSVGTTFTISIPAFLSGLEQSVSES